jgi:hypothetical protein
MQRWEAEPETLNLMRNRSILGENWSFTADHGDRQEKLKIKRRTRSWKNAKMRSRTRNTETYEKQEQPRREIEVFNAAHGGRQEKLKLKRRRRSWKNAKMKSWTRNTDTYEKQEQPRRETKVLLLLMEIDKKNWSYSTEKDKNWKECKDEKLNQKHWNLWETGAINVEKLNYYCGAWI